MVDDEPVNPPDPPCDLCGHRASQHDLNWHCEDCEDWGGPCA